MKRKFNVGDLIFNKNKDCILYIISKNEVISSTNENIISSYTVICYNKNLFPQTTNYSIGYLDWLRGCNWNHQSAKQI